MMKAPLVAALTLAMLVGQANGALTQGVEDASEHADKALAVELWRIAAATHTRIGFQSVEAINPMGGVFRNAPDAIASSLDEALDVAIASNPRYEWRRVGDGIVVRPMHVWNDAADPFNHPVRRFRAERTNESQVLRGIAELIRTGVYQELPMSGTPVDFSVESGTLIDVLNKLAESADIVFWQAGCRRHDQEDRLSLSLTLVNARHLRATMLRPSKGWVRCSTK